MSAPLLERLKSILVYEEEGLAPSKVMQAAISSDTANTLTSADLANANDYSYVGNVVELLDGSAKGQFALITAFDNSGDVATTTNFTCDPGASAALMWDFQVPLATIEDAEVGTSTLNTILTGAGDDYYNGFYVIGLGGTAGNLNLYAVTDYVSTTGIFTVAVDAIAQEGDLFVPVKVLQGNPVEITVSGGTPLEREISTDTLAQEGVLVGAIEDTSINLGLEVRGLATAAGDDVTAEAPAESGILLDKVFTESLATGGTTDAVTNAQYFDTVNTSFANYDILMVNGECAGITSFDSQVIQTEPGHITTAPASSDVVYGSASYKPKDTGHSSVGFMAFRGDGELNVISGCMPSVQLALEGNSIGRLNMNYMSTGGVWCPYTKNHEDVYDSTAPVVVKSNQSRVVIGGTVLEADVMSVTAELLPAPEKKGGAFNCFENNGGLFYTERNPSVSMTVYFEDSSYIKKFRSLTEFDLLIQVGSVAGNAMALWIPRAQLVESPAPADDSGLMTQTLNFRALRPTTANQPDFVYAIL